MKYQGKNIIGQYLGAQSIVRKYLGDVLFWENVSEPEYRADIIATYNVTSTTYSTALVNSLLPMDIEAMWIDGVYNNPSDVEYLGSYKFPTKGEHTVVYKLYDNTPIPNYAFNTVSRLTRIELGDTIKSIGNKAFGYCNNLTSITIPDSVTSIGSAAFEFCSGLAEISIPSSVTTIGDDAFSFCSGLEEVTILDGTTSIGGYAFYNCSKLTSITIPETVTSIGDYAFYACNSLTEINALPTTAPTLNGNAFNKNAFLVLNYPCGSDYSVWIDMIGCADTCAMEEVTDYDILAVYDVASTVSSTLIYAGYPVTTGYNTDNIVTMYIDDIEVEPKNQHRFSTTGEHTVKYKLVDNTSIASYAFDGCSGLTSIDIPDSVTSIDINAFYRCSNLTSITIPDSVTSISDNTFNDCSGLTSINLGNGVTSIGESAFSKCSSLTSIDIPDSVTSIDINAFQSCGGVTSITLGSGITSIGIRAFDGCNKLSTITCKATKAPEIASNSFKNVMENGILYYPSGSNYSSWMKTSSYYLGYYNWTSESF